MIVGLVLVSAVFAVGLVVVSVFNARRAPGPVRDAAGDSATFQPIWGDSGDGSSSSGSDAAPDDCGGGGDAGGGDCGGGDGGGGGE
jgi:hypothetical protein